MISIAYEHEYAGRSHLFNLVDRLLRFDINQEPIRHHASDPLWDQLKGPERSAKVYTGIMEHELYFGEPLASTLQNIIPFHYFWGAYFELRPKRDIYTSRSYKIRHEDKVYHGCTGSAWHMRLLQGTPIIATLAFKAAREEAVDIRREFPPSSSPTFQSDDATLLIDEEPVSHLGFDFGFTHHSVYDTKDPFTPTEPRPYAFIGRLLADSVKAGTRKVDLTIRDTTGKEVQFVFQAEFRADGFYTGIVQPPGSEVADLQVYLRPPM